MPKAAPVYSTEKSAQLGELLRKMAANPKGLLLRDLVKEHKSNIQSALDAGYTYDDIITAFKKLEITIRPTTLKQYLRDPKDGKTATKAKQAQPKQWPPPEPIADTQALEVGRDIDSNPAASNAAADTDNPPQQPSAPLPSTDRRGFQRMRSDDEL